MPQDPQYSPGNPFAKKRSYSPGNPFATGAAAGTATLPEPTHPDTVPRGTPPPEASGDPTGRPPLVVDEPSGKLAWPQPKAPTPTLNDGFSPLKLRFPAAVGFGASSLEQQAAPTLAAGTAAAARDAVAARRLPTLPDIRDLEARDRAAGIALRPGGQVPRPGAPTREAERALRAPPNTVRPFTLDDVMERVAAQRRVDEAAGVGQHGLARTAAEIARAQGRPFGPMLGFPREELEQQAREGLRPGELTKVLIPGGTQINRVTGKMDTVPDFTGADLLDAARRAGAGAREMFYALPSLGVSALAEVGLSALNLGVGRALPGISRWLLALANRGPVASRLAGATEGTARAAAGLAGYGVTRETMERGPGLPALKTGAEYALAAPVMGAIPGAINAPRISGARGVVPVTAPDVVGPMVPDAGGWRPVNMDPATATAADVDAAYHAYVQQHAPFVGRDLQAAARIRAAGMARDAWLAHIRNRELAGVPTGEAQPIPTGERELAAPATAAGPAEAPAGVAPAAPAPAPAPTVPAAAGEAPPPPVEPWEAEVERYAAAAPTEAEQAPDARPEDRPVAPAEKPGLALHDAEGRPIPGTEIRPPLMAGEPERRVAPPDVTPPVFERRGVPPAPGPVPEAEAARMAAPAAGVAPAAEGERIPPAPAEPQPTPPQGVLIPGETIRGPVVAAAGGTFPGATHEEAARAAMQGLKYTGDPETFIANAQKLGRFETSTKRIVKRDEAMTIARAAHQVRPGVRGKELHAEHLLPAPRAPRVKKLDFSAQTPPHLQKKYGKKPTEEVAAYWHALQDRSDLSQRQQEAASRSTDKRLWAIGKLAGSAFARDQRLIGEVEEVLRARGLDPDQMWLQRGHDQAARDAAAGQAAEETLGTGEPEPDWVTRPEEAAPPGTEAGEGVWEKPAPRYGASGSVSWLPSQGRGGVDLRLMDDVGLRQLENALNNALAKTPPEAIPSAYYEDQKAIGAEWQRRRGGGAVMEREPPYAETVSQGNLFGAPEATGPTGTRDLLGPDAGTVSETEKWQRRIALLKDAQARGVPVGKELAEAQKQLAALDLKARVASKIQPGEVAPQRLGQNVGETEPPTLPGETPLTLLEEGKPYGSRPQPQLSALHNLSAENLAQSDKLGGFPAPSLAVVPENVPHTQYGEITMIGRGSLVEPSGTPIYSADAYTGRPTPPEYNKVPTKMAEKFIAGLRKLAGVTDVRGSVSSDIYEIWDDLVNRPKPDEAISGLWRSATGRAAFLAERGLAPAATISPETMKDVGRFAVADALIDQIRGAGLEGEFARWTHDRVMANFTEPFVRVRGKKMPYTLENVVASSPKGRAKEKGLTYGPGTARAAASTRFTNLEQMRRAAAKGVRPRADVDERRKALEKKDEQWRAEVVDYYTGTNWEGRKDIWNGLDAVYRALGRWGRGGKTVANLRIQLSRQGFANVPQELIDRGVEIGTQIMSGAVPYFEGKPTRGVRFDEFAGAVIPADASAETKAILDRRGISYRTYATPEEREAVTKSFRSELDQGQGHTLREVGLLYHGSPHPTESLAAVAEYTPPVAGTAEAQQMELVFGNAAAHEQAAKLGLQANRVPTFDERRAVIPEKPHTWVDVRGKRVDGAQDVALIDRPFRSPTAETIEFLHGNDAGEIAAREAKTSGAIDYVDLDVPRLAAELASRARRTGAYDVWINHNHPSGNVTPSGREPHGRKGDIEFTEELQERLDRPEYVKLAGGRRVTIRSHTIIDHDTVSHIAIGADGKATVMRDIPIEVPPEDAPDWTQVRGPEINSPGAVAALAGRVPDNALHVYYRDNVGRAVTMVPHRKAAAATIGTWLPQEMRAVGAVRAIVVTPGNDAALWRGLSKNAPEEVLDVIGLDAQSGVYESANARGVLGGGRVHQPNRPARHVVGEEGAAPYGASGAEPVPSGRGAGEPVSGAGAGLFGGVPEGEDLGDLARSLGEETDPAKRRELIERVGRIYDAMRAGRGPAPDINPTDYLNVERMDPKALDRPILEDEVRRAAERMYPEGRPVKGFNEALAEAQKIAADPRRLAGIPVERMSGTERLAERLLASAEIARHGSLLRRLADPTLRDAEREGIEQALASSDVRLQARLGRIMKGGTAQGRDLAYNRILANQTLDPATWLLRAQRVRGDVLTPTMREKILGMLGRGEIDQLAQYVAKMREPGAARKLAQFAKTNMISALTTVARIFTGSQFDLWLALAGPGRLGELMADRVVRGMTKVETRSLLTGMRDTAIRSGATQLVDEWGKIIRGEPVTGRSDVWGLGEFTNVPAEPAPGRMGQIHYKAMQALDAYEHAVTRTHMGVHRLGWAPAYQKSLAEQALLLARESLAAKGVRPKLSDPAVQGRAHTLFAHPTDEMQNVAIEEARLATYLNRNAAADAVSKMKRALATAELPGRGVPAKAVNVGARAAYLASEMTVPFAQISTNLIARGLETTPLGMATSGVALGRLVKAVSDGLPASEVEALQREFTRRAGRLTTGALLTLLGLYLYYRGRLIGYGPKDAGGKQAMKDQGASEFSLKLGDHWWSLTALGPLMMALGGAAAIGEAFDDPQLTGGKRALAALTGAVGVGARESLLRGLQTGAKAVGEPLTAGVQWAESAAGAMIPAGNFLAKIAVAADPWQRHPQTFTQAIASRIPGARLTVPKATGRFGQPLPGTRTLGEAFSAIANPFLWRPDVTQGDPVLSEVARVKASVPAPKRRKGQSEEAYQQMTEQVGAVMLAKVREEIGSGEYHDASTEDQKYFIEREARAGEREVLRDVGSDEPPKPTHAASRSVSRYRRPRR